VPDLSRIDPAAVALLGILIVSMGLAALAAAGTSRARRARDVASLSAIDFVRNAFVSRLAHGEPLDELLPDVVEELRATLRLDAAELWLTTEAGDLRLTVSAPARRPVAVSLTPNVAAIVANAPVSGRPWLKVWLTDLLPEAPDVAVRLAPIAVSGELLGLILIQRTGPEERLAAEADITLVELATEFGSALRKQRLDSALHESLALLRRQAADLQASRARIVASADAERRRIERDLHDGAQQYLVAIAVKAGVVRRLADRDPPRSREMLDELVDDTQLALDELRTLAHGIFPPLLGSDGLCEALSAACRRAVLPTAFETSGIGRYPAQVEAAVYFCCLEALQNAAKYAGDGATARVALWEEAGGLLFEVRDDGAGFDAAGSNPGFGLTNMSDRLGAVGGTLTIESAVGAGTHVRGAIPVPTDA
jgi:signal transduction histidine kinase